VALQALLLREGIESDVEIGVRRESDGLVAHAWVEIEGRPVGETVACLKELEKLEARGEDSF
jgi:hypothetical protein